MKISPDKAYVLGLFVGGGEISSSGFQIVLPFDKWGENPRRMGVIARDILKKMGDRFLRGYGLRINFEIGNKRWLIVPLDDGDFSAIADDLGRLGLPRTGVILQKADLKKAKKRLKGLAAENFLSGIFDARASIAKSHRRFTKDAPIVSIEIPGSTKNFEFVVQLCSWLTSLGSITDQILYNHPCQHSPADPSYKNWKKGFKIRFLVKSFIAEHSFALASKADAIIELEKRQKKDPQEPCRTRTPRSHILSIHEDIGSNDLPKKVRNKLFLHYHHICAVMGCPYAPLKNIHTLVEDAKDRILAFPRLLKGRWEEISDKYDRLAMDLNKKGRLKKSTETCEEALKNYPSSQYPEIESGLAYLFSRETSGKRHVGPKETIIEKSRRKKVQCIRVDSPDLPPILLSNRRNGRSVILSSPMSPFNRSTINRLIEVKGLDINVKQRGRHA